MKHVNDYNTRIIEKNVERLKKKYPDKVRLFTKRAEELKRKYPDKTFLFDEYIRTQKLEIEILGTKIRYVTWMLEKIF